MSTRIQAAFRVPQESERVERERSIVTELKKRDSFGDYLSSVVVEEVNCDDGTQTLLHFGNPYLAQPTIVTLPSRVPAEEVRQILKGIIAFPEACDVLTFLAENYAMRLPVLIEGPTALGKTFLINKLVQLMYGRHARPVDFYCQGQTDVSELMARWVPKVQSTDEREVWEKFISSARGEKRLAELVAEAASNEMSDELRQRVLAAGLKQVAQEVGIGAHTAWELQYGAVPKAMLGEISADGRYHLREPGGRGVPLHIQEVGLARPQVVSSLLKLRGELGQITEEIQLWEDGGRSIRPGPDFWFAMSTNPPEEYDAREPVDQALARGVVFKRIPPLSKKSYEMVARRILGYQAGNVPAKKSPNSVLELHLHPKLCAEVAEVVAQFHLQCVDAARTGESARQQRIPVTFDDMARVAKYMALFQARSAVNGHLDLTETVRRACERMYLERLLPGTPEEAVVAQVREDGAEVSDHAVPVQTQLRAALEQLLTGETGMKRFNNKLMSRKQIFDELVVEASASLAVTESSASLSTAERSSMVRDQARNDAQDAVARARDLMARRGLNLGGAPGRPAQPPSNP